MVNKEQKETADNLSDLYRENRVLEKLCTIHKFDKDGNGIISHLEIRKTHYWYEAATDEINEIADPETQKKAQADLALKLATE